MFGKKAKCLHDPMSPNSGLLPVATVAGVTASSRRDNNIALGFALLISIGLIVSWHTAMHSYGELARFPDEAKFLQASSLMATYISESQIHSLTEFLALSRVWPPLTQSLGAAAFLISEPSRAAATFVTVLLLSGTMLVLALMPGLQLGVTHRILAIFTTAMFLAPHTWIFMSDMTLSCFVLIACLLLIGRPFACWWRSLLLGVVLGLGALAKWSFAFYLILPLGLAICFELLAGDGRRRRLRVAGNICLVGILGLAISLPWYIVNWHVQVALLSKSSLEAPQASCGGIPLAGLHVISHQYLSPLFFLLAAISVLRARGEGLQQAAILMASVLGGVLITSWMDPLDDPSTYRYHLPALAPTILLAYSGLRSLPPRIAHVCSALLIPVLGYAFVGLIGLSRNAPIIPPTWGTSIVYTDRIAESHVGLLVRPSSYLLERPLPDMPAIEAMAAAIKSSTSSAHDPLPVHVVLRHGSQFPWAVIAAVWLERPQQRMSMHTGVKSLANFSAHSLRIGGWVLLESALMSDIENRAYEGADSAAQLFFDALVVVHRDSSHALGFLSRTLMMQIESDGSESRREFRNLGCLFHDGLRNWNDVVLATELSHMSLLPAHVQQLLRSHQLLESQELGAMPVDVAIRFLALGKGSGHENDTLYQLAERVVDDELDEFPAREFHPGVDFLALKLSTVPGSAGEAVATFFFRVRRSPEEGLRLFLHGIPSSPDCLPDERMASGFMNWYFIPEINVADWRVANGPFVLRRAITATCPGYELSFGFYRPGAGPSTSYLKLGRVDFPEPGQEVLIRLGMD